MQLLSDFHASGVSLPDIYRPDIDSLVERIPDEGTLHLAILQPPYLDLIVEGIKTVESRFNTKRAAPFGRVAVGDLVLLKETGQPVTHYFFIDSVASVDLAETPVEVIRSEYGQAIQAQDEENFWQARESSRYATLMGVGEQGAVPSFPVVKKDQRGWVTFSHDETLFEL